MQAGQVEVTKLVPVSDRDAMVQSFQLNQLALEQ